MDFILEMIFEVLLEGTLEVAGSRKVPLWIRIPLMILFGLFFGFIIVCLLILGLRIMKENILGGILMIGVDVIMVFGVARYGIKFKRSLS